MPTVQKRNEVGPEYQSLISYGRQIFRLCVGTVLFGTDLAQRSALHDKLTTNQERLELICTTLNDRSLVAVDRFTAIDDIVATVDEYRYILDAALRIETILGVLQAAAKTLLGAKRHLILRQKPVYLEPLRQRNQKMGTRYSCCAGGLAQCHAERPSGVGIAGGCHAPTDGNRLALYSLCTISG